MTPAFDYGAIANPQEAEALGRVLAQCFNSPVSESPTYFKQVGLDNFRRIVQNGQMVGGLAQIPMGQWWGHQNVSMTGIAAVGIAPPYRGSGAALTLMQHTVRELHQRGVALSVLYPAIQRLYRKTGYEQAGTYCGWEIETAAIHMKGRSLPVHALAADPEWLSPLYNQQAQQTNGHLDRPMAIWQQVLKSDEKTIPFVYGFGEVNQLQGYVVFIQEYVEGKAVLRIRDWAMLTAAAGQTFWTFLADHRSQIDRVRWRGSAIDPLTLLLPEQGSTAVGMDRWLMRIIHVPQALEQRGYPSGVETELHLEVQDDLMPDNTGRFILSVAHQRGTVTRGGRGDFKLDIRSLAPLYTGLFSPHQLHRLGRADATEDSRAIATHLFAGPPPWMPDFF